MRSRFSHTHIRLAAGARRAARRLSTLVRMRPSNLSVLGLALTLALTQAPGTTRASDGGAQQQPIQEVALNEVPPGTEFDPDEALCGTPEMTEEERAAVREALERFAASRAEGPDERANEKGTGTVVIPVYFHVIMSTQLNPAGRNYGNVSDTRLDDQIRLLNDVYGGRTGSPATPFRFVRAGVTRTVNESWYTMGYDSPESRQAMTTLRVGGRSALNILTANPAGYNGWASFPWEFAGWPLEDGVVLNHTALANGTSVDGDSVAHEVGHWLGLYHTFQGGCPGAGDEVDDTPAEAMRTARYQCSAGLDTCPSSPGLDPTDNLMDYSFNDCRWRFTPGQVTRMDLVYQ